MMQGRDGKTMYVPLITVLFQGSVDAAMAPEDMMKSPPIIFESGVSLISNQCQGQCQYVCDTVPVTSRCYEVASC